MKLVTYTDPSSASGRFVVKVDGKRHRFPSGEAVQVSDAVAAAVERAAPDGSVSVKAAPGGNSNSSTNED